MFNEIMRNDNNFMFLKGTYDVWVDMTIPEESRMEIEMTIDFLKK